MKQHNSHPTLINAALNGQPIMDVKYSQQVNKQATQLNSLVVCTSSGTNILDLDNIIRFESDSNYTSVFITGRKKPILVSKTLMHFERTLKHTCFIRVHQSHLVNSKKIVQYIADKQARIKLTNNEEVAVSRSRRSRIKNYLMQHNYSLINGR